MEQDKWEHMEKILDQALSLESLAEQKKFILQVSKKNPSLSNELNSFLEAIHQAQRSGFLEC